jgi:hypothetical protein
LTQYQSNPEQFRWASGQKTVSHLLDQAKVAVRDGDPQRAAQLKKRLAILDPNDKVSSITGIDTLLGSQVFDTLPEAFGGKPKRKLKYVFGLLIVLIVAPAAWWSIGSVRKEVIEATEQKQELAILKVNSNVETHVFLDGRALGKTPDFAPAVVPAGSAKLEFSNSKFGKLRHEVNLVTNKSTSLYVDWKKKRVRSTQE